MDNLSLETKSIFEVIKEQGPIRFSELVKTLNLSSKTVHKHISRLLDDDLVKKIGTHPKVFYVANEKIEEFFELDKYEKLIDENYIYVSEGSELIRGIAGFKIWCDKSKLNYEKEKEQYFIKYKGIQKLKKNGLISAKKIILSGKEDLYLENIYFSDFYNFDHFGKTKLGQLTLFSKSSQNRVLTKEIAKIIKPSILKLIERKEIKYVCYIPPTIDRKVQFIDMLKKSLKLELTEVKAFKIQTFVKVPQKTIRKLDERIKNAQRSIAVDRNKRIDGNILIIDDATGSGATLNETAKKIKNIANKDVKVFGYSIVGSYKGFDVINEI